MPLAKERLYGEGFKYALSGAFQVCTDTPICPRFGEIFLFFSYSLNSLAPFRLLFFITDPHRSP
jgi:hypothetical protein